jgi:hypothetical protein
MAARIACQQVTGAAPTAGDTDGAAMEMEDHLRVLRCVERVVRRSAGRKMRGSVQRRYV